MEKKRFSDQVWEQKLKQHSPIAQFLTNNQYHYAFDDSKKVIVIDDKITVIDRIPTFSRFLGYFDELTKNYHALRGFKELYELYPKYKREKSIVDEKIALKVFEKQGSAYINAKNPMEFMATAQHFGLPTRLIDFTTNPFIALFFAMYSPLEDDREYYYIACADFKENLVLEELPIFSSQHYIVGDTLFLEGFGKENQYYSYYKRICYINQQLQKFYNDSSISKEEYTYLADSINEVREMDINGNYLGISSEDSQAKRSLVFVEPCFVNERIKNQQGLFMYPYDDDIDNHISLLFNNTSIIAIHKSYREDVLLYLDRIGITEYKLFPDLASICSEIVREYKK